MKPQGIDAIWPQARPLVGMVHLLPLPGSPSWAGSMQAVLDRAAADAAALTQAGFDAVLVENYGDAPFFRGRVPPETIAALTASVLAVTRSTAIPVGVNVLRNDAAGALGIASATGARFVRVNVHTGSMWTDQGLIEGRAAETLRLREVLAPDVAILADIHVKHGTPPTGSTIGMVASDAWNRGRADALVVSGVGTGSATQRTDVEAVRAVVPNAPVLVGSGLTAESARSLLQLANGAIIGSVLMRGGLAGAGVDPARAGAFVSALRR